VIDEVGYLTYGPEAANVLYHVVNDRHLRKRPMVFTTNKPLSAWGRVLHDPDLAAAILDRVLERGRWITLDGPSGRTKHLKLETDAHQDADRARISGTHIADRAVAKSDSLKLLEQPLPVRLSAVRTGMTTSTAKK
jgi:hypothetical protein